MLHISDSQRTFPLQAVPYLDMPLDDLFQEALAFRRANCPDWTDESPADFGTQLLWIFSVLAKWNGDQIERAMQNCFIGLTQDREIMRRLCEPSGYVLSEAAAATVIVEFTVESGHPEFTIPAGTQVATKESRTEEAIVFETTGDQVVAVGVDSVDVECIQGESVEDEIIGSSDGTTYQSYDLAQKSVVWQSETVDVHDGGAWVSWTRVDHFAESDADDKHYRIELNKSGIYSIIFGDGVNGRIPTRGVNNLRASYRKGDGSSGNVGAGTITEIISSVTYLESVNNTVAASGGTDRESLEHARVFAPIYSRTLDRGVTLEDFENLSRQYVSSQYGAVANAKAYSTGYVVKVMVVPASGGNPSAALKSAIQTYLGNCRTACLAVSVINPAYKTLDIDLDVTAHSNYNPSRVAAAIRDKIVAYLSPTYMDPDTGLYPNGFGRNVYLSDLYAIIDAAQGVDYCTINDPTQNVIVKHYEIADLGTISITVTLPTGQSSHFELGK